MEIKRTAGSAEIFEKSEALQTNEGETSQTNSAGIADAKDVIESVRPKEILPYDLGKVEDKYIGETEKNLNQSFEKSETNKTVLFFDEADALFDEKTSGSDDPDSGTDDKV